MSDHFDALETRDPAARERDLMRRLPQLIAAGLRAPGWRRHLGALDPTNIESRAALARLPVLRKSDLIALQANSPPLAGLVAAPVSDFSRLFVSPGPICEVEGRHNDCWRSARALFAAGLRAADGAGVENPLRKALLSGAAFAPPLQTEFQARGIDAYQMYATADLGLVAYETAARAGLVVAEDVLLEIVRPGTGDPLGEGEVGEVVVTSFDPDRPWIRLAL